VLAVKMVREVIKNSCSVGLVIQLKVYLLECSRIKIWFDNCFDYLFYSTI